MAGTDGATGFDDPALAEAMSALEADGVLGEQPSDLESVASQPDESASAAVAAAPIPDGAPDSVPATDPDVDPYEGTEPYTYGANKATLEGFLRVPGEGLIIPEDQVHRVEALATERDTLSSTVKELTQARESLERLSEWRTTGENGQEQIFRGAEGIVQLHEAYASQGAALNVVLDLLKSPAKFVDLIAGVDANNVPVLDQAKLADLVARAGQAETIARYEARTKLVSQYQRSSQPSGPPDYAKTVGAATITTLAGEQDKHLTAQDRQQLLEHFNRYVAADGKSIAPEFQRLVLHMAAQSSARKAEVAATDRSSKFNAGQQRGRVAPKAPAAPKPVAPITPSRPAKADWNSPLDDALAEMGIAR